MSREKRQISAELTSQTIQSIVFSFSLFTFLVFLLTREVGIPAPGGVDPSFQQAYAYFFRTNAQAAQDYVFTYGPLAYFLIPRYDPSIYWIGYFGTLAMGIFLAWPVFTLVCAYRERPWSQAAILLPFLLTAQIGAGHEIPSLMVSVLIVVLVRDGAFSSSIHFVTIGLAWSFFSLTKFSLMVVLIGCVGYLIIHLLAVRKSRSAAILFTSYLTGIFVFWIAARQNIMNFPQYIIDSLSIAESYSSGMQLESDKIVLILAYLAIAGLIIAIVSSARILNSTRVRLVIDLIFLVVFVYILWKLGMTRNNSHESKFFIPMMILPFFVSGIHVIDGRSRAYWGGAALFIAVACIIGYAICTKQRPMHIVQYSVLKVVHTADHLTAPTLYKIELDGELALSRRLAIYEVRKVVGDSTIDVFSPRQSILLSDGYNYHPRYVFQGYQACTPRLLINNGKSYWGTGGTKPPEFILYRIDTIDDRLPTMEDSQALLALLYCYEPIMSVRGHILCRRISDSPSSLPDEKMIQQGRLELDVPLYLPDPQDEWMLATLEFSSSIFARIKKLAGLRTSFGIRLFLNNDTSLEYTVIPSMTSLPFLIHPNGIYPTSPFSEELLKPEANRDTSNYIPEVKIEAIEIFDQNGHTTPDSWEIEYSLRSIEPSPHWTLQ